VAVISAADQNPLAAEEPMEAADLTARCAARLLIVIPAAGQAAACAADRTVAETAAPLRHSQ